MKTLMLFAAGALVATLAACGRQPSADVNQAAPDTKQDVQRTTGHNTAAVAPTQSSPAVANGSTDTSVNLIAQDNGGRIEQVTSEFSEEWPARGVIDEDPQTSWAARKSAPYPQDLVFSFFNRELALVARVVVNPQTIENSRRWAKDIEIWTSTESTTDGFVRVASMSLRPDPVEQTARFEPVEARFLKLRILSNQGDPQWVELGTVKVFEAERAGYQPLLARHPELQKLLTAPSVASREPANSAAADLPTCAASVPTRAAAPRYAESHQVVVITRRPEEYYPPIQYQKTPATTRLRPGIDSSLYQRVKFTPVLPEEASAASLAAGADTVVLAQVCDVRGTSETLKRALMAWVADGHKLIVQDSDRCGPRSLPDYGFFPYRFATSNPGGLAKAERPLIFVEENSVANANIDAPSFLDVPAWLDDRNGNENELGDSNLITAYDPRWCGHLFSVNALGRSGLVEAYAHYGKGLIIYNGFDIDQAAGPEYRQLVTRELVQPFDPDSLPCSARIGDFLITTEQRLKIQPMVPSRSYAYPLTLLSNQGYAGAVMLTLAAQPADPTLSYAFDPPTVNLKDIGTSRLSVTTTAASLPGAHALAVRGADASGHANVLCLQLIERKTGGLKVVSRLGTRKPTKNLEIVLDASGSMKLPLGRSTRWRTALDVFRDVIGKLPDDFSVGLRVYGHRYPSRARETCTDSELMVPPAKLDRNRLLSAVAGVKPRGETPLVFSVLETTNDLRALGGGTVVVITDGEESCGGDPAAAARALKASGLDLTLNIVGFTLTGRRVQEQLSAFAEATGGRYYSAQNGETLARALLIAAVEKFPYSVVNAAGRTVARGEAGGPEEELPPGEYTVIIQAGDQELRERVSVATASDATLNIVLKGDRFAIER